MIRIKSNSKELQKYYKPNILEAVKSYKLNRVKITFIITKRILGGKISFSNVLLANKCFVGNATVYLGRAQSENITNFKVLTYHELGHIVSFAIINAKEGSTVKIVKNGFVIEPLTEENAQFLPWLEVVAEFLSCKFGDNNVKKYILERPFDEWKWWKNGEAFSFAKYLITKLLKETKDMSFLPTLKYALNKKLHSRRYKKLYMFMFKGHQAYNI